MYSRSREFDSDGNVVKLNKPVTSSFLTRVTCAKAGSLICDYSMISLQYIVYTYFILLYRGLYGCLSLALPYSLYVRFPRLCPLTRGRSNRVDMVESFMIYWHGQFDQSVGDIPHLPFNHMTCLFFGFE